MADEQTTVSKKNPIQTVGRRKEAVARVVLRPGDGEWDVNGRDVDAYFPLLRHREVIARPLRVTETEGMFDIQVRARGGGLSGQADAVQLGVARALLELDEDHRDVLRTHELLTRDGRVVERKKFQFSKR